MGLANGSSPSRQIPTPVLRALETDTPLCQHIHDLSYRRHPEAYQTLRRAILPHPTRIPVDRIRRLPKYPIQIVHHIPFLIHRPVLYQLPPGHGTDLAHRDGALPRGLAVHPTRGNEIGTCGAIVTETVIVGVGEVVAVAGNIFFRS